MFETAERGERSRQPRQARQILVTTKVGGGRTNVIGPGTNFFGKGTLEGGPNIKKWPYSAEQSNFASNPCSAFNQLLPKFRPSSEKKLHLIFVIPLLDDNILNS